MVKVNNEEKVRSKAVMLIIEGKSEEALELLSRFYGVEAPKISVGLPKGHAKALGCYDPNKKLICIRSSKEFYDPFVIMHEFYHHLRFYRGKHRGTERRANEYATNSIKDYLQAIASKCKIKDNL